MLNPVFYLFRFGALLIYFFMSKNLVDGNIQCSFLLSLIILYPHRCWKNQDFISFVLKMRFWTGTNSEICFNPLGSFLRILYVPPRVLFMLHLLFKKLMKVDVDGDGCFDNFVPWSPQSSFKIYAVDKRFLKYSLTEV